LPHNREISHAQASDSTTLEAMKPALTATDRPVNKTPRRRLSAQAIKGEFGDVMDVTSLCGGREAT
jgi:hypothetical protein